MSTQRGFTVAELIVALLISGVLATVLAFVIQQMVTVPEKGSAQVEASHTMQDVISTISYDIVGAKTAVAGSNLTLTIPDYSVITYYRSGNELKLSVDGDVAVTHGLLRHEVGRLDGVLERLRGNLVQPRLLGESLPRSLDVQVLVDVVGPLDVGERHALVLAVRCPGGGARVLERFVRPSLELAFGLVRRGNFRHGCLLSLRRLVLNQNGLHVMVCTGMNFYRVFKPDYLLFGMRPWILA
jgi:prepilin-type N-terminal cleavage/methylation domain-containing protein